MRPLDEALADRQTRFYAREGLAAFAGTVPFRLSTSRAMARLVATAATRFAERLGRPRVRLVDVGAGSGRLGFHLLALGDERLSVVLTDASPALVEAWRAHPQLAAALSSGHLAVQCAAASALGEALHPAPDEALVLCGTYLLDTLPHALLEAPARRALVDEAGALHFEDAALDPFSRATLARLGAGRVFVPTGAFAFLRAVEAELDVPALVLLADKGACTLDEAREPATPRLARHGDGASVWVNFDALRAWLGWRGWLVAPGSAPDFVVGATVLHGRAPLAGLFEGLAHPLAAQQAVTALRHAPPGADWWRGVLALPPDGDAVLELADALCAAPPPEAPVAAALGDWLLSAVRASFFLPADDVAFQAGRVLYRLGFVGGAAACFSHSLEQHGETTSARLNRALCLAQLGALDLAREDVGLVLERAPDHEGARSLWRQLGEPGRG